MAEPQLPKLLMRVRFSLLAPKNGLLKKSIDFFKQPLIFFDGMEKQLSGKRAQDFLYSFIPFVKASPHLLLKFLQSPSIHSLRQTLCRFRFWIRCRAQ